MWLRINDRLGEFERLWGHQWLAGRSVIATVGSYASKGTVVDVGCGDASFRRLIPEARYIGVDRRPFDGAAIIADAGSLPFADCSADVALAFHVLSDLPDPSVALDEIKRILRPGGWCLVLESTCYPEHDLPHDYVRLLPKGLELYAKGSGLEPIALVRLGGFFSRCAQLWNSFVMGWLTARGLVIAGRLGVLAANLGAYLLDKMLPHPRLSPDYLYVLRAVKEGNR